MFSSLSSKNGIIGMKYVPIWTSGTCFLIDFKASNLPEGDEEYGSKNSAKSSLVVVIEKPIVHQLALATFLKRSISLVIKLDLVAMLTG